ncbi:unnamed protein product [Soboliphyme baturini]|uniref:DUF4802 domain-containing protein n=1 Tax=Soboliphyme baturini TaxID=241478 RepID=A0A183IGL1_9BILA|nr:unnamed protein product [Soboliphyme baturini]
MTDDCPKGIVLGRSKKEAKEQCGNAAVVDSDQPSTDVSMKLQQSDANSNSAADALSEDDVPQRNPTPDYQLDDLKRDLTFMGHHISKIVSVLGLSKCNCCDCDHSRLRIVEHCSASSNGHQSNAHPTEVRNLRIFSLHTS